MPHATAFPEGAALPESFATMAPSLPVLPPDFRDRFNQLSPITLLKIPNQHLARLCEISALGIENGIYGFEEFATLEEASPKLLLARVPKGLNKAHEVKARLKLWDAGELENLLRRIEEQQRRGLSKHSTDGRAAVRAQVRRGTRNGAYRKSVQRATSSVAAMSPEDERKYAQELLPDTEQHRGATVTINNADPDAPTQPGHPVHLQMAMETINDADPEAPTQPGQPVHLQTATATINNVDPPERSENTTGMDGRPKPLEGVHFAAESGPGPSGRRPEHFRDMLRCSRRRSVNRLLRALADMENKALAGELPDIWRWILRTRLIYIKKKTGTKPRPVRVGEVLRRIIAKHSLHHRQERIRQAMLKKRQYGVSLPGGAEVLVHARDALEDTVCSSPAAGVWAMVDVDLVNCFPSLEWAEIESAMEEEFPDLVAWTRWCHKVAADIFLPSGGKHQARRGAEQGDPHASLQCGLVVARCVREAMAEVSRRKDQAHPGVFDFWFADDGQLICRAQDVDLVLECLDAALAKCGASRGEGKDVKSVVRLVGHPGALDAFFARGNCDK